MFEIKFNFRKSSLNLNLNFNRDFSSLGQADLNFQFSIQNGKLKFRLGVLSSDFKFRL